MRILYSIYITAEHAIAQLLFDTGKVWHSFNNFATFMSGCAARNHMKIHKKILYVLITIH
jgi:hypothetical protein